MQPVYSKPIPVFANVTNRKEITIHWLVSEMDKKMLDHYEVSIRYRRGIPPDWIVLDKDATRFVFKDCFVGHTCEIQLKLVYAKSPMLLDYDAVNKLEITYVKLHNEWGYSLMCDFDIEPDVEYNGQLEFRF